MSITVVFTSIAPSGTLTRLLAAALSTATLLAALRAAGARLDLQRLALLLAALAIAAASLAALTGARGSVTVGLLALGSGVFVVLAPLTIVRGLLRHIRDDGVNMQIIAGALAVYLLIGLFFGLLVAAISEFASSPYFVQHTSSTPADAVYYSFVTLSTVGYGDYTPALGIGRGLAIIEGVTGQLYLVTVVALLIGNLGGRGRARAGEKRAQESSG